MLVIDKIVRSDKAPRTTKPDVLWIDTSEPKNPSFKIFEGGQWISATLKDYYTEEEIDTFLAGKMNIIESPTSGNILIVDAEGQPIDSGKTFSDLLAAPTIAGLAGQVLTSNGEGGTFWETLNYIINPEEIGTAGQILSLDTYGNPTWINPAEGSVVDNTMSDVSENPVQNKVIKSYVDDSSVVKEWVDSNYARATGKYVQLTSGLAVNLEGDELLIDGGYTLRPFGVGSEVADGQVRLTEIRGRALPWNQLLKNDLSNSDNYICSGSTTASYSNGKLTITFSSAGSTEGFGIKMNGQGMINGHKYYLHINGSNDNDNNIRVKIASSAGSSGPSISTLASSIIDNTLTPSDTYELWFFYSSSGATYTTIELVSVDLIDLTLMCGAGSEPATVAGVEAYLASRRRLAPYYAQNAGQLLGARMKGWSMPRTLNLLNPTTKQARLPEYSYTGHDNEYTVVGFDNLTNAALQFTPDKTGVAEVVTLDANNRFVIPSTGTLEVVADGGDITGEVASVCVLMTWDGSMDTEYQPFEEFVSDLDSANIYYDDNGTKKQAFEGGVLRAVNASLYDSLKPNIITKKWEAKVNVGNKVFKGTESWAGSSFFVHTISKMSNGTMLRGLCNKFIVNRIGEHDDIQLGSNNNMSYWFEYTSKPSGVSTVEEWKTWLATQYSNGSPVELFYELATPVTHTNLLYKTGEDTYVPLEDVMPIDGLQGYGCNWATESLTEMPEDAQGQPQAITPDVTEAFNEDLKEGLKTLLDEREGMITVADMKAQLQAQGEALKSAGLITGYTLTDPSADSKVIGISYTTE